MIQMKKEYKKPHKAKKESHTGRNVAIVLLLLIGVSVGIFLLLEWSGTTDLLDNDDDKGYGDSGISESEWFDEQLAWTEYTNPDDATVSVFLPHNDFEIEESVYWDEINGTNVTDFGGFDALWANFGEDDSLISARAFIVLYANLEESNYTADDLHDMLVALLELTGTWVAADYSPIDMIVDDHGLQSVDIELGEESGMQGLIGFCTYDCNVTDRSYSIAYGVAKNTSQAQFSEAAALQEIKDVFKTFHCHS
jgi:hypothetical protein